MGRKYTDREVAYEVDMDTGEVTGLIGPREQPINVPFWKKDENGGAVLMGQDGTQYKIGNTVSLQSGIPVGIAPNGTIATDGALTLGTALPTTYSTGIWLYFPAGAVSGDATGGLYWCVMSNTTQGIVYAPKVSTNNQFIPYLGNSTNAVTGSNSAYTQTTNAYVDIVRINLQANSLGARGRIFFTHSLSGINNANQKQFAWRWVTGSTNIYHMSMTTTPFVGVAHCVSRNRGVNRQMTSTWNNTSFQGTNPILYTSINTSVAQSIVASVQLTVATDFVILEGFSFEAFYSD